MTDDAVFVQSVHNLVREYHLEVLTPCGSLLESITFPSLNALIEWAYDEKMRRLSEIEDHI